MSKPKEEKADKLSVGSKGENYVSNKKRKSWCVDASRTSRKKTTTYRKNPKKISCKNFVFSKDFLKTFWVQLIDFFFAG